MSTPSLSTIRRGFQQNVGRPVELTASSRRRPWRQTGVLEGAYASVFTVAVPAEEGTLRLSSTYADVLTKTVRVRALR